MTRILLLENKALPLHRLRTESRRSGVPFLYDAAATEDEFTRLLALRPGCLVSGLHGLADLPVTEIAMRASQAAVPLLVIGATAKKSERFWPSSPACMSAPAAATGCPGCP